MRRMTVRSWGHPNSLRSKADSPKGTMRTLVRIGATALLLSLPVTARAAPTKEACIAAFDHGQQSRRDGALRRAREELLVCSQQECPAVVRADCAGVLREVDAAQPTIV